jgi:UDP-4-amino-4-deoxy-L-arabinose-oxoglutarate aminotransferase
MSFIYHSKPWITTEDRISVEQVLLSNIIDQGQKVSEFEEKVACFVGAKFSIAVGSGTAALILALKALNINKGDEVILPTYVCHKVRDAIYSVGATPIFCDVGEYWHMTPKTVGPHISVKTKAIILVHIFGIAVDAESFKVFNVPIIENYCQAFGTEINGRKLKLQGAIGIFSFHATKCLTTGEGGMVITNNFEFAEKLKKIRFVNSVASPMTNMQAALGINQLTRYSYMLSKRKQIARLYFEKIPAYLTEKLSKLSARSIFFRFPITVNHDFNKIKIFFRKRKIFVKRGVDNLLHRSSNLPDAEFPNATELYRKTLSLPIYPALTEKEQGIIIDTTREIFC